MSGNRPELQRDLPLATTRNGTYSGVYDSSHDQFQFLGIPYATPPVGDLRFRPPQYIDESWDGIRSADSYGPMCPGYYRGPAIHYAMSEDCLTVNVVVPSAPEMKTLLPVAVWYYGGGPKGGASRDGRYNMSFLVSHATQHDMPFISVSFNFRSSIWGFIRGAEVLGTGNTNLGLRDQRLALHWLQENIAGFGGDPRKVTIMGGSSGAENIGFQLTAYGGRDDGLFRAAILQSGTAISLLGDTSISGQDSYDQLLAATSCNDTENSLDCLRHVPFEQLNGAFDNWDSAPAASRLDKVTTNMASQSVAQIDGDFIRSFGSVAMRQGNFVKVPIINGVTSNEGFAFIPEGLDSANATLDYLYNFAKGFRPSVVDKLLSFYPELPDEAKPLDPPIKGIRNASGYDRLEHVLGDFQHNAAKRLQCGEYARHTACYSYRFDAVESLESGNPREGVRHGAEIPTVFQNYNGEGFWPDPNPFEGRTSGYFDMAKAIGLMWAGFITQLDPNHAFEGEPWPKYNPDAPRQMVFNETGPFWVEDDLLRKDATDYIYNIMQSVLTR
ncbi:cholinesterase [Thozetella sp. PMI_491]|nr:cholinesterase [Thozetella sp. PMI_491]